MMRGGGGGGHLLNYNHSTGARLGTSSATPDKSSLRWAGSSEVITRARETSRPDASAWYLRQPVKTNGGSVT